MTRQDEAARQARAELLQGRIDRIRDAMRLYDAGQISAATAVSQIEEIASGEADRVVRVGHQHRPEVET